MCDTIYKVKNCENSSDQRYFVLANSNILPGDALLGSMAVGKTRVFTKSSNSETICAEIISHHADTAGCLPPNGTVYTGSYDTDYLVGDSDCSPSYKITNCKIPSEYKIINWVCGDTLLDVSKFYRFKDISGIDSTTVWSVEKLNEYEPAIAVDCSTFKAFNGIQDLGRYRLNDEEDEFTTKVDENYNFNSIDLNDYQGDIVPFDDPNDFNFTWYSDPGYSNLVPDPTNVAGSGNTVFYTKIVRKSDNCMKTQNLEVQPCYEYDLVNLDFTQNQTGADFDQDTAYSNFTSLLTSLSDGVFANNSAYTSSDYIFKWYPTANDRANDTNQIADNTSVTPFSAGDGLTVRYYFFEAVINRSNPTVSCIVEHFIKIKLEELP